MLQLENKCEKLEVQMKMFQNKFSILEQKGIPSLKDSRGELLQEEDVVEIIT